MYNSQQFVFINVDENFDFSRLSNDQINEELDIAQAAMKFFIPGCATYQAIQQFYYRGINELFEDSRDYDFHLLAHSAE